MRGKLLVRGCGFDKKLGLDGLGWATGRSPLQKCGYGLMIITQKKQGIAG